MWRPGGGLIVAVVTSTEVRHGATAAGLWARAVKFDFFILFLNLCQELDRTNGHTFAMSTFL
jgi:hypothetical protein